MSQIRRGGTEIRMSQIRRGGTKQLLGWMTIAMNPYYPLPPVAGRFGIRHAMFPRLSLFVPRPSSFVPRPSRPALTLLEVLIAMFVLAIGLLGVASLLPVGQFQVRQGSDDLRAAELAEQAFGAMETFGVIDPTRWMTAADYGSSIYNKFFDAVDPSNETRMAWTVVLDASNSPTTFKATPPSNPPFNIATPPSNPPSTVNTVPFNVTTGLENLAGCLVEFVRGRHRGLRGRVTAYNAATSTFTVLPDDTYGWDVADAPNVGDVFVVIRNQAFAVDPYFVAVNGPANNTLFADGVPRVTLTRTAGGENLPPTTFGPMEEDTENELSEEVFQSADDELGDFSWLATLVPGEGGIYSRYYTVSVAVFRKRGVRLPIINQHTNPDSPERAVNLAFAFNGNNLGGGTATLFVDGANAGFLFEDRNQNDTFDEETEKSRFKPQQWLLVSNREPDPSQIGLVAPQNIPKLVYRWYRIGSVGNPYQNGTDWGVDVQLVGPDWDTDKLESASTPNTTKYMATVYDDLIAVFQRRLQLKALPVGTTN